MSPKHNSSVETPASIAWSVPSIAEPKSLRPEPATVSVGEDPRVIHGSAPRARFADRRGDHDARDLSRARQGADMRKLLCGTIAVAALAASFPAVAAPLDDEAARLEAIERENAILRKENAALRERAQLQ